jgi:amino acid transporter
MLYAMGRDGGLPAVFGRTHARYKTPWVALLFVTLITLVLGAALGLPMGPFVFLSFLITTGAIGVLLAYMIVAFAGIVFFSRSENRSRALLVRILDIVLPVIAIFLCGGTLFSSVWPVPHAPLNLAPYIVVIWLVLGSILVGWLWRTRPELVRAFGKILAGASEDEVYDPQIHPVDAALEDQA